MKKPQFNLSKQGIKDFFFRHIEKLFFGLALGMILFFCWFGFQTPAYQSITPVAMMTKTEQAERYIHDETHWNKLEEHRTADTQAVQRIRNAKAVDPDIFSYRQLLGSAVFSLEPRRDPALAPPEDFEVQHIRAQVALKPDESGSGGGPELKMSDLTSLPNSDVLIFPPDQQNEMFVYRTDELSPKNRLYTADVVVGMALINHRQQLKNYEENFQYQRGYDPVRDVPEYIFIEVQRKTADTDWQPITASIYSAGEKLASPAKELTDERYILEKITLPVPPLLGLDYRQFSMKESVPMKDVLASDEPEEAAVDEQQPPGQTDPFGGNNRSDDEAETAPESASAETTEDEDIVPTRLVRFYDLQSKEVGETYYYRLRVWLKDPNNPAAVNATQTQARKRGGPGGPAAGGGRDGATDVDGPPAGGDGKKKKDTRPKKPLDKRDLSRTVRDRLREKPSDIPSDIVDQDSKELFQLARPTEWVEAEQPVTITKGFETFVAGPVDPPTYNRFDSGWFAIDEPAATVVANSFQNDLGVFVPAETEAMRGSLLNFDAVTNLLHPLTWEIKEVFTEVDNRGTKRGRRFETDAVLLDIMGGERQPFSKNRDVFFAPGEILIMDRNGRIHVRSDIEDITRYRHANFISADNTTALEEADNSRRNRDRDDDDITEGG